MDFSPVLRRRAGSQPSGNQHGHSNEAVAAAPLATAVPRHLSAGKVYCILAAMLVGTIVQCSVCIYVVRMLVNAASANVAPASASAIATGITACAVMVALGTAGLVAKICLVREPGIFGRLFGRTRHRRKRLLAAVGEDDTAPMQDAICRICHELSVNELGSNDSFNMSTSPNSTGPHSPHTLDGQSLPSCSEDDLPSASAKEGKGEELARFCHCRGSLAFAHRSCLQQWRMRQNDDRCELCGAAYFVSDEDDLCEDSAGTGRCRYVGQAGSYMATIILVWLWLHCSKACDGEDVVGALWEPFTQCILEKSVSGWLRSGFGATAIGLIVRYGTMVAPGLFHLITC